MRAQPTALTGLNEEDLAELVRRSCAGDVGAWKALWPHVAGVVASTAGRFRALSRLSRSADERSDVVVRVMEELRRDDFRLLAELGERLARRDGSWRRWLSVVALNMARTHVREHAEYLGHVEGGGPRWATYAELSDEQKDERPDPAGHVEAHIILAWAREQLSQAQHDALVPWLEGTSCADIARGQTLAGGEDRAVRLVRSAVQQLRRQFAGTRAPRDAEWPESPWAPPRRPQKKIDRPVSRIGRN